MADDSELIKLYSKRILALAADIPHLGQLQSPDGRVKKRSPLCGSTVTADVSAEAGRISDFAQNVKACALGQAAASVLGRNVVGLGRSEISRGRDQLYALLKENGPPPTAPFEEFEVLRPAHDFKNRHASIMLAIEATLEALDQAIATQPD